ncbi:hypothetical protein ABFS82_14G312900 [Erythranthe guttata]|uniref:ethylene-responsive transcription factor ERF014 n=1 Tax=Erythranthe guttata TaxID=4155 RepID=UPI00064DFC35|nr:PREDICTED: ethylene-responsive transcription factor ERF014 [Erythranthe guttata]|eukprot:XP_012853346.1 PREDICTED: ethylene-responsive transcription factor ERF014 [Erythranthe guttata]
MVKAEKKMAAALITNDALIMSSSSSSSSSEYKKKYKGVRMRSWGSWVSEIRAPNQKTRIWLGSHSTPEAAARAYDAALFCLKGSSANFNFPFSIRNYSDNTSSIMSPKSIQRVAAAAANTNTNTSTNNNPTNFLDENLNILSPQSASASVSTSVSASSLNGADSSPSLSSSSPNHPETTLHSIEDDLISLATTTPFDGDDYSWYNFESPKYYTEMVNGVFFDPHMIMEDSYEDAADIRLWSFC